MKSNIELSIIVPIYNCEKYLNQCLSSILNQQVDNGKMQIICVDDCSQDDSRKIVEELARKNKCIQVHNNKSNMGPAAARNIGLSYATGHYVLFLDADDYLTENILNKLLSWIQYKDPDIVLYDMIMFSDEEGVSNFDARQRIRKNKYEQQTGLQVFCEFILNDEMFGVSTGSIYRKEYLQNQKIHFLENGQHEDISFIFHALLFAKNVCYFDEIVYHYRQRRESILHSPNYRKLLRGLISGYIDMQSIWEKYKRERTWNERNEECVRKYFCVIENMIEERYVQYLASEYSEIEDVIINKYIGQFNFLEKKEIETYIREKDLIVLKNQNDIAIYGAGYYAKKIFLLLQKNNIGVKKFYVTVKEQNPSILFGIPVVEYHVERNQECIIIAVSAKYQKDIIQRMKMDERKIIFLMDN